MRTLSSFAPPAPISWQQNGVFPTGAAKLGYVEIVEHFTSVGGMRGLAAVVSGTVAAVTDLGGDNPDQIGQVFLTTGTDTTGRAAVISSLDALRFAGGRHRLRWDVKLNTLSDGTNTYTMRAGLIDSASAEPTDGCYFRYTDAVNGGKWQAVTRQNGTETATDTGSTASTSWTNLELEVNPLATSVAFYINGALVATNTTNIPTGAARLAGIGAAVIKSAGTTARLIILDLMAYSFEKM